MNKKEITRTFPDAEPKGVDSEVLSAYISVALNEYLTALRDTKLETRTRTICRPKDDGMWCGEIEFPLYRNWDPKWAKSTLEIDGVAKFLQYIWESGELSYTLTGPDPTRSSWELFVLYDVMHNPLSQALTDAAIEVAIEGDTIKRWHIPEPKSAALIDELVLRISQQKQRYVAKCPLAYIEGPVGSVWELGDGMSLRILTDREKAGYLSRIHNRVLWHDSISSLAFNTCILELVDSVETANLRGGNPPKTGGDIIEEHIADTLDIVKWSLGIAFQQKTPLIEGTITYEDILGGHLGVSGSGAFRREEKSQGTSYELTKEKIETASTLIKQANKYLKQSTDLKQAFWYWGRSCLADIDRDIILDSIIGIEHLLVPSPGESRYRFGLHGSALLSNNPQEAREKAKELRKTYDRRSKVAHGKREDRIQEANMSRNNLGAAIEKVIECFEVNLLNPKLRVSDQIEEKILKEAYFKKSDA